MDNFVELKGKTPDKINKQSEILDTENHSIHRVKYHNVLLALLALMIMPIYLYGYYVAVLAATALITAFVIDFICIKLFMRTAYQKYDYSSYVTALITVMLMPATAPVWVIITSVAIGLFVAKYPFGGTGHNIFNPAAAGVAFCALCWPELVLRYPVPYTTYGLPSIAGVQYTDSPASVLRVGGTPKIDFFDILLGKFAGPMGATCMIVLAACLIYLFARNVASKRIVISTLLVVCVFSILFPRLITGESSLLYELPSGALIFGVIFMANDPSTNPKTGGGRIFYGVLLGLFVVMFKYFGQIELEFVYAILLANVFASSCDSYSKHLSKESLRLVIAKIKEKISSLKKNKKADSDKKTVKVGDKNA